MLCSCGRPHTTLLAEKPDADKIAVEDLSAQAREQSGPIKDLTEAKIEELKAEIKAEQEMGRALTRAQAELVATLDAALELTSPEQLLALSREQLLEFVIRGGLGLAVDDFVEAQDRIIQASLDSLRVIEPSATTADVPDLDALRLVAADNVFEDIILPDSLSAVRTALQGMTVGVAQKQAMTSLSQRLKQSQGRQLTQFRTQLASTGRAVTASAAQRYELDLYLYTGPRDGITRDFCRPLINKVVDEKQMNRLNNGQGLPVATYGGGYNCRHSWSPITESFQQAAGLKRATAKDISRANAGGAR
jgi:hypothetical protein